MSHEKPYLTGRPYIFRLEKGDDLLESLQEFCHDNQIKCGTITGLGALSNLTFGFFNQKTKKYEKTTLKGDFEIIALNGNVSIMENRSMVHLHIGVAGPDGKMTGGHLMSGSTVFAVELFVQELVGAPKIRKTEKATGLPLWLKNKD